MTRIWQDFRGGTDGQPVTKDTMDPGGIPASFIIIDNESTTGPDISYSTGAGQRLGYPMGAQIRWSGVPTYLRWDVPNPNTSDRHVLRFPMIFDSAPTTNIVAAQIRNTSGDIMAEVGLDTMGRIYWNSQSDVMPEADRFQGEFGVIYWTQVAVTAGTTDTDGIIEGYVQNNQNVELFTWSNTGTSTGTIPIQHYRVGLPGTDPSVTADMIAPIAGLVMGDLSTGWWPRLSPTNINIRPIEARRLGPGETHTLQTELWNQEGGATWAWSQISGPDLSLTGSAGTATIHGPHRWNAGSATPDADPIGMAPATVEVTAFLGSDVAPPMTVSVDVLPQITWTRAPGGQWVGGKVAPWCVEE